MSSLRPVGRSAAANKLDRTAVTHKNDRKTLCCFTFADGRQCRSPRSPDHPHLCPDHARKDSQSQAAAKLARELSYFFSSEYLSACDLSTALGRIIAAVARGDIKPRAARTLAYLSQTLVQTIHVAENEFINARGTDSWRKAVNNSVHLNYEYRNPSPSPEPHESPQPQPQPQAPAAAPTNTTPVAHPFRDEAIRSAPQPLAPLSNSLAEHGNELPTRDATPPSCREASAVSESQTDPSPITPTVQPSNPSRTTGPCTPQPVPTRDAYPLHFDHNCRLLVDGKPI